MRRGLAALALATGCLGPSITATPAQADRLTLALCRALRVTYDARLAREEPDVGGPPPAPGELRAAWDDLRVALSDLGVAPVGTSTEPRVVLAARDVLIAHDVVVLPPSSATVLDPGLALARVTAREAGLSREVLGQTVRYRRVEHRGLLLPDYPAYAAQRAGRPAPLPLARAAGLTVYLDRAAIERRAGQGAAGHLDPDGLAREAELRQVAALRFASDLEHDDALPPGAVARGRVRHHASVLLATVALGDAVFALAEVERLSREPGVPPEVSLGALGALEALAAEDAALAPAERAHRALVGLRRGG
jgi:hypothetical protein